jgi:hypothetical protein
MAAVTHPPRQLVRDYLAERIRSKKPPPPPAEIRRRLGWNMIPENGSTERTR